MLLQKSQAMHFLMLFVIISRIPRHKNKCTMPQIQEDPWHDFVKTSIQQINTAVMKLLLNGWRNTILSFLHLNTIQWLNNFVFESSQSQHTKKKVLAILHLERGQWDDKIWLPPSCFHSRAHSHKKISGCHKNYLFFPWYKVVLKKQSTFLNTQSS